MTKDEYEKKLQELREEWKAKPHLRDIIERRARALKIAQERRDDKHEFEKEMDDMHETGEVFEEVFGDIIE